MLLSTMKAYWEGKKELFRGLKIEELESDNTEAWQEYPVFYLDFNRDNYNGTEVLEGILEDHLVDWESKYSVTPTEKQTLAVRFKRVIRAAFEQSGKRCVVLVDEYDKPLLEIMENPELLKHNKEVFKGFFSNLKSEDECIQFIFITGVTKYSKVSIFSDLNQLRDISMSMDYSESDVREAAPSLGQSETPTATGRGEITRWLLLAAFLLLLLEGGISRRVGAY